MKESNYCSEEEEDEFPYMGLILNIGDQPTHVPPPDKSVNTLIAYTSWGEELHIQFVQHYHYFWSGGAWQGIYGDQELIVNGCTAQKPQCIPLYDRSGRFQDFIEWDKKEA